MINSGTCTDTIRRSLHRGYRLVFLLLALLISSACIAQPNPPKPISIHTYPEQGLRFGAFTQGTLGGTISVTPDGFRSTTGDVYQLSLGHTFSAALFEIEGEPGTRIQILVGPNAVLTSNTGGTMTLHISDTDPASPFIITVAPPSRMQVRVGGTLTVGSPLETPPGIYNGTFNITFIQE